MQSLTTLPLSDFFGLFAPRYLIGTTYTASLAFFESVVFPEVDRSNLTGAVILCDECGFAQATAEGSALIEVTKSYSMVLAPKGRTFHAKVWIMVADDEFAVLCGSGNLTQSGFIRNHELFEVVRIRPGGNERELAEELASFVKSLVGLFSGLEEDAVPAKGILAGCHDLMVRIAVAQKFAAQRAKYFLSSFGGNFADQISKQVGGEVRRICVAAPFFGGSDRGISLLRATFPGTPIAVFPALHGDAIDIPRALLGDAPNRLRLWSEKKGFAHLKLYGFDADSGSWLFSGSVNCTDQALAGTNIEAGILRRVAPEQLAFFFAPDGPLPEVRQLSIEWRDTTTRWLRLWAANSGAGIALAIDADAKDHAPLSDVTIELRSGSESTSCHFARAFVKSTWTVHTSDFPQPIRVSNCLTVRIVGTNAIGQRCEGVAFVDDTGMLNATPTEREARAGLHGILSSNGILRTAELGALFDLVDRVLEGASNRPDLPDTNTPTERHTKPKADRAEPIWPPRAGTSRGSATEWNVTKDGWFQHMLEELLRPTQTDLSESEAADLDPGKKPVRPKQRTKAAQQAINLAKERFAKFSGRVHAMVPDAVLAHRLVPVAVGYFHLCHRIWLRTSNDRSESGIHELVDIARLYTKSLFDRRHQSRGFTANFGSPYRHHVFPPIVWDIHSRFGIPIDPSLIPFHVAIFALLKAYGGAGFSKRQWLTFQSAAKPDLSEPALFRDVEETIARLFEKEDKKPAPLPDMRPAVKDLMQIGWRNEPAYRELEKARAANRRILPVDPYQRFCPSDSCPRIASPEFDRLSAIDVLVCPTCRSLLAPVDLFEAFNSSHGS